MIDRLRQWVEVQTDLDKVEDEAIRLKLLANTIALEVSDLMGDFKRVTIVSDDGEDAWTIMPDLSVIESKVMK